MQLLRCDHIHLKAQNVEETVAWYRRHMGAEITFEGTFSGSKVCYISIAGMNFIVFGRLDNESQVEAASILPKFGVDHFGFEVDDVELAVRQLQADGVKLLEGPLTVRPGLRIAYIQGPDQVRIELSERH